MEKDKMHAAHIITAYKVWAEKELPDEAAILLYESTFAAFQAGCNTNFGSMQGNDQPCYYCGEPCNSLAGNPGVWPIHLTHKDDPGKVKWHHIGCVQKNLVENQVDDIKEKMISDRWKEVKPTIAAQKIRSRLAHELDSMDELPDHVWDILDIGIQMGINLSLSKLTEALRLLKWAVVDFDKHQVSNDNWRGDYQTFLHYEIEGNK